MAQKSMEYMPPARFARNRSKKGQRKRIAITKRTATMGAMTFRAVSMTKRRDVGKRSATTASARMM